MAVHDLHRSPGRGQMHPGEGTPAPAHGEEGGSGQPRWNTIPQQSIDLRLRGIDPRLQQPAHWQRAERQADVLRSDAVIEDLGDFQAAPAHVATQPDGAVETGNDTKRAKTGFFLAA